MGLAKVSNKLYSDIRDSRSLYALSSDELVNKYAGLVKKLARQYNYLADSASTTTDDLVQRGYMGLLYAASKFKNRRFKVRFGTYAVYWIISAIKGSHKQKQRLVYLDDTVENNDGSSSSLHEVIASEQPSIEKTVLLNEIWTIVDSLPNKKMRLVMQMRYKEGMTLEKTGQEIKKGLTRERVRQIEESALKIIRNKIEKRRAA